MEIKNKKELKVEKQNKKKSIRKKIQFLIWASVSVLILYGLFWIVTLPRIPQSEVVLNNGLHWHSKLSITVNGKNVNIPADIGINAMNHSSMHTHKSNGIIHMEYSGVVYKKNLDLGKFFDIWGKKFSQDSFMGNSIGKKGTIKMTVNGKENSELENYSMKNGDVIDITYNSL